MSDTPALKFEVLKIQGKCLVDGLQGLSQSRLQMQVGTKRPNTTYMIFTASAVRQSWHMRLTSGPPVKMDKSTEDVGISGLDPIYSWTRIITIVASCSWNYASVKSGIMNSSYFGVCNDHCFAISSLLILYLRLSVNSLLPIKLDLKSER